MVNKRPAVALCCAMMGGIVLHTFLSDAIPISLFVFLPAVLIVAYLALSRFVPGFGRCEYILTLLIIAAFGVAKARFDDAASNSDNIAYFTGRDWSATCIGTIVDPPRLTEFAVKCVVE